MNNKFNFLVMGVCVAALTHVNGQSSTVSLADVKGTPYLSDSYSTGVIYFANKKQEAPIRYNAFQDLIEYQQSGRALVLDPTETIKKVCVGTLTFLPQKYEHRGKSKFGYLTILDSGKVMLFSKKQITFLPARKGGALDGSDQPAEFKPAADVFYYKVAGGILQEMESLKSMIASLPDKQEELTKFVKKEKISSRKEADMIQMVKYYNSLQE